MVRFSFLSLLAGAVLIPSSLYAQDESASRGFAFEEDSVSKPRGLRLQPFEFRGLPAEVGGFLVNASLLSSVEFTDNVIAADDAQGDIVGVLNPRVEVLKEFGRHSFGVRSDVEIRRHVDNTDEDIENYEIGAQANFEATRALNIPISVGYANLHRERESVRLSSAAAFTETPLELTRRDASIGFEYKPNRFGINFLSEYVGLRFDDNTFAIGGGKAVQSDRDFDLVKFETAFSYDFSANWQPRLILSYEDQDFKRNTFTAGSFSGVNRSNEAIRALIGGRWNYKNLIIADVGVGVINRSYEDATIEDATNLAFQGSVIWEPTQRTHLDLNFNRTTIEDNLVIAGVDRTGFGADLDYELRQNVFLRGSAGFVNENFTETDRTDNTYSVGGRLQYILSPRWQMGAQYQYKQRDSDVDFSNFEENRILFSLTGSL